MSPTIELFSYAQSPYAAKVHACLNAKGLPFTVHYVQPIRSRKELAFSGQYQIPVLRVGDIILNDSTPICLWLEQHFPEALALLPKGPIQQQRVLDINQWISDQLIPSVFKTLATAHIGSSYRNFWRLANVVNETTTGLSPLLRAIWPLLARQAPFVKQMLKQLDTNESAEVMRERMYAELSDYLGDDEFLAGSNQPSLADLAAYPQLINHFHSGCEGFDGFLDHPKLLAWLQRVQPYADGSHPLLPASCVKRALPFSKLS